MVLKSLIWAGHLCSSCPCCWSVYLDLGFKSLQTAIAFELFFISVYLRQEIDDVTTHHLPHCPLLCMKAFRLDQTMNKLERCSLFVFIPFWFAFGGVLFCLSNQSLIMTLEFQNNNIRVLSVQQSKVSQWHWSTLMISVFCSTQKWQIGHHLQMTESIYVCKLAPR